MITYYNHIINQLISKQMKKVIAATMLAMLAVAGYFGLNANCSKGTLNDLQLANAEALASGESFICRWKFVESNDHGLPLYHCLFNGTGNECTCGSVSIGEW